MVLAGSLKGQDANWKQIYDTSPHPFMDNFQDKGKTNTVPYRSGQHTVHVGGHLWTVVDLGRILEQGSGFCNYGMGWASKVSNYIYRVGGGGGGGVFFFFLDFN